MKKLLILSFLTLTTFTLSACSVFGHSGVENAPYKVIEKNGDYELRHYDSLILVSTPMNSLDKDSKPFRKLFNYISGGNAAEQKISMTAPVFMDQDNGQTETMSFVLPKDFSIGDSPAPQDPSVKLEEIKNYTVATITFSGRLSRDNIDKNQELLENWIAEKGYKITGAAKAAGYNPPFTVPAFRRNEVLIPIEAN